MANVADITLRNYTYRVNLVDEHDERLLIGDQYHFGLCRWKTQEILIADCISGELRRRVIAHEITHAIVECYGLFAHKDRFDSEDVAEFMAVYAHEVNDLTDRVMEVFNG